VSFPVDELAKGYPLTGPQVGLCSILDLPPGHYELGIDLLSGSGLRRQIVILFRAHESQGNENHKQRHPKAG
jgi:hypothetical protein